MKIAPSILSADFLNLESEIKKIESHLDYIHIDVMDGVFVPNLTIGPPVIKRIRKTTSKPLDVHIMVSNPFNTYKWYIDAGADILTFHIEALGVEDAKNLLRKIRNFNIKAGISINPETSIKKIEPLLGSFDQLLVMSVKPGFGGQSFLMDQISKIKKAILLKNEYLFDLEVDGGINRDNIEFLKDIGVDIVVAGNSIFNTPDSLEALKIFKELAN